MGFGSLSVLGAGDNRLEIDKSDRNQLKNIAEPLKYFEVTESSFRFNTTHFDALDQERDQRNIPNPTLSNLYEWIDPDEAMGLPKSILQLVGYAYALNEGRVLENQGRPYHVDKLQKLHDELVLVKPDLPSETKWHQALEQAAKLFGISLGGRANNFKNLQDLTKQLTDKAVSLEQTGSQRLPDKLRECAKPFLPQLDAEVPPRLITATSAQDFVGELLRLRDQPVAQVDAVADFAPQTSPEALLKHFQRCSQLTSILSQTANWLILNKVVALQDNPGIAAQAKGLLGQIQEALSQDELIVELGDKINQLIVDVNALEPTKPPQPPKPTAGWEAAGRVQSNIEAANRSDLADQLHSAIQAELEKLPESGQLKANVQINFTRKTEQ